MVALLIKVLLLTVSWGVIFWMAERELSNAKPLSTWGNVLSLPAMIFSAVGIVHFTSSFEGTLPQAIWVCPLIGVISPLWLFAVRADRRTIASVLFGMATAALIAFAVWPHPRPYLKSEKLSLPTIEEITIPMTEVDDFELPALPLPHPREDQVIFVEP